MGRYDMDVLELWGKWKNGFIMADKYNRQNVLSLDTNLPMDWDLKLRKIPISCTHHVLPGVWYEN